MPKIYIGGNKGGTGKTTLTVNLAALLASQNKDVMIIDADLQKTSTMWNDERSQKLSNDVKEIYSVQKQSGDLSGAIRDLSRRYEYVFLDAAGVDQKNLRYGLITADVFLVPFKPTQFDLNNLFLLQPIIEEALIVNPELNVSAVISMSPTNPRVKEVDEAKDFLSEFPQIKILETFICERSIYHLSASEGLGVTELKAKTESNKKAQKEIINLLKEIGV
ncbi:chromosome partitioning protein [Bathymodiolus japonicus methanotrophic gill symbiont]|uniref:AAA family ATPase n=1 Tax=Bathymodiolus japonicus methanotrophic gill symbiont TaxID=113269 RepID=UPI001B4B404A|nr:AAA family ATPase [Bathymodiolus japonicus methanotrophic gill symbiont]GFO73554.1 chromosome partitioning protein [Bathymodiolus japonicus methanotrophic gill symbiont]